MIQIRPAVHADVTAIARVVSAAYAKYIARIGKPPGPMRDDYSARVASGVAHVAARHDGGIVGLLVLLPQEDHLLLDNIAVAPEAQGQGVGKLLLAFAEQQARVGGFRELRLYTNEMMHENIALYARQGWLETGRATEHGFSRVFFRKALS